MLMSAETLRKIEGQRIEGQAMMVREETMLTRLRSLNPEELAQVLPTATQDILLSSLLEQLTMAEQKLVSLKKEFGPDYTEVQKVSGQVEDLQTKIKSRANGIVGGLETRVEAMRKSQEVLEAEVKKAQQADQSSGFQQPPLLRSETRTGGEDAVSAVADRQDHCRRKPTCRCPKNPWWKSWTEPNPCSRRCARTSR